MVQRIVSVDDDFELPVSVKTPLVSQWESDIANAMGSVLAEAESSRDVAIGAATANIASDRDAAIATAIAGVSALGIKNITSTAYLVVQGDELVELRFYRGGTATIQPDSVWNAPIGTVIPWAQYSAGSQVSWLPGAGVTIKSSDTGTSRRLYSSGYVIKEAANSWRVVGDVVEANRPAVTGTASRIPGTTTSQTSWTVSHTVPAGDNRMLLVNVHLGNTTGAVTSVSATYNGVAMSLAGYANSWATDPTSAQRGVAVLYLVLGTSATPTTANVVITLNATSPVDVTNFNWINVNQTTPIGEVATAAASAPTAFTVTAPDSPVSFNDVVYSAFSGRTNVSPSVPDEVFNMGNQLKNTDFTARQSRKEGTSNGAVTVTQAAQTNARAAAIAFTIKSAA